MSNRGLTLPILSAKDVAFIEQAAFRLLETTGIALDHPLMLDRLQAIGCMKKGARLHIPRQVVQECLQKLDHQAVFRSRNGALTISLAATTLRTHNGGGPPFVLDMQTGQRRLALLKDAVDMTRLLDALPEVDIVLPLFGPQDVPAEIMTIAAFAEVLRHTTKPIGSATVENPDDVTYILALTRACLGKTKAPPMSFMVSPISPLRFSEKVVEAIMAVAEAGAQFQPLPAPTLGGTAPITLAGAVAQQHAEILASLVMAAVLRPGLPVMYSSRILPLNLHSATASWGGPEVGMAGAYSALLAHRIGLTCDSYGFATNSTGVDAQLAGEKMANALTAALGGVDILSGIGTLDNALTGSYETAVLDNDMAGVIKHIVKGYPVDEDTVASEVIDEIVREDGTFLAHLHTADHARTGAVWQSPLEHTDQTDAPEKVKNKTDMARDRAETLIRTHSVESLSATVEREFAAILAEARRELIPNKR